MIKKSFIFSNYETNGRRLYYYLAFDNIELDFRILKILGFDNIELDFRILKILGFGSDCQEESYSMLAFLKNATEEEIEKCLSFIDHILSE